MRCCATCRGHRSLHWHRSRFPANGAAPRGGRRSSIMGLAGRDGFAGDAVNPSVEACPRLARVRCPARTARPGLGVLPNPPEACLGPMPRTPPQTHPARPRTVSVSVHHGKEREDQKRIASLRIHAWRGSTVSTKVDTHRQSQLTHRHRELSGVGRCGAAGPLAPWMAPSSPQGRVYGVSCSPTPPRPTLSNPERLWLWLWLWPLQVQGCKPCKATTSPSLQSPAGRGSPATAAASATPGSSHHAGPAAAATPATALPRCNRARPRAARR